MHRARHVITLAFTSALVILPTVASGQGTVQDYARAIGLRDKYHRTRVERGRSASLDRADQPLLLSTEGQRWSRVDPRRRHDSRQEAGVRSRTACRGDCPATPARRPPLNCRSPLSPSWTTDVDRVHAGRWPGRGGGGGPGGPGDAPPWRCSLENTSASRRPPRAAAAADEGGGGLAGPVRPRVRHQWRRAEAVARRQARGDDPQLQRGDPDVGSREVVCSAPTGRRAATSSRSRWRGRQTRPVSQSTRSGRASAVSSTTSSRRRKISCSPNTPCCSMPSRETCSMSNARCCSTSRRRRGLAVDTALFPDAYDMSRLDWRPDSSAVTFEYNQRGHQVYRVI